MLKFLSIENFALVERLEIEFGPGLTLITGETGSGKSILVDAVGLLAGERASQEMVREGFEKARLEGLFSLTPDHPARRLLEDAGLDGAEDLIVRREIGQSGSNKVFVNGRLATQGFLAELGCLLADIHGQHDQQLLLQPRTHLDFLDAFGQNAILLGQVRDLFRDVQSLKARLGGIRATEKERLQKLDTYRYQLDDIEKLALSPGLDLALESERGLLVTSEKRFQYSESSYQLLYESEGSILGLLNQVQKSLEGMAELDLIFQSIPQRSREIRYQLEEMAFQLRDYAAKIEFNPARLEEIEARLSEIQNARRKYGDSVDEILSYADRARKELAALLASEHETGELSRTLEETEARYFQAARALSEKRRADSQGLCRAIEKELEYLSMQDTVLQIALESSEELANEKGIDEAEFLISPNLGETPRPLAKIASGGELSRVILAMKSVLTLENYPKTLVFDEIDSGIGGRVASNVGEKLAHLSANHQVFCVTHLPQIALHADHHFHLEKKEQGKRTLIQMTHLDRDQRVEELARMLAGETITASTLQHARELLESRTRR